ncbi:hypothetical protein HJC23_010837 [Cyclotella cryptica]|uniref:Uncharacterized protein n=1 Tax=Cyclotella cryptica TaxID=29204 RepID=A0ABD3QQ73_9STRA
MAEILTQLMAEEQRGHVPAVLDRRSNDRPESVNRPPSLCRLYFPIPSSISPPLSYSYNTLPSQIFL